MAENPDFLPEYYKIYNGQQASMNQLREENHGSDEHVRNLIDRGVTVGQMDLFGDIVVFPINYRDYAGSEAQFEFLDAEFYTRFQQ